MDDKSDPKKKYPQISIDQLGMFANNYITIPAHTNMGSQCFINQSYSDAVAEGIRRILELELKLKAYQEILASALRKSLANVTY